MQCVQSVCAAVSGSHCLGHCCCSCRLQALAVNAVVTHGFRNGDTTDSLNTTLCYVVLYVPVHAQHYTQSSEGAERGGDSDKYAVLPVWCTSMEAACGLIKDEKESCETRAVK